MDAQQAFKSTFKELINEDDHSIANDITQHQGVLKVDLSKVSKVDFSIIKGRFFSRHGYIYASK